MNHQTIADIPPPPPTKVGWPWKTEFRRPAALMPDGTPWPRVTIITPSFNQGRFIEETIRSVLLQRYPNLEYFVIDGGSTDETVDVIRKYEPWLQYWVSEADRGQSHAINKGFVRARGDIVTWLNSDDTYQPEAIETAVRYIVSRRAAIVYGNCNIIDEVGDFAKIVVPPAVTFDSLLWFWRGAASTPPQPAIFFRRCVLEEVGLLDESLQYVMDYDLWLRIARKHSFSYVDAVMANYRMHSDSKTVSALGNFSRERYRVGRRYAKSEGFLYHLSLRTWYAHFKFMVWRSRIWRLIKQWPGLKLAAKGVEKLRRRSAPEHMSVL